MNVVLLGSPGAGKGTQARFLREKFGFHPVGMGDLLRDEVCRGTELGLKIAGAIGAGLLLDNNLVRQVLERKVVSVVDKRFVFDGIPRSLCQALFLEEILGHFSLRVDVAICLRVPDETSFVRILDRLNCSSCGAVLSRRADDSVPKCTVCGGRECVRREDDREDVVKERLRLHKGEEALVLRYYEDRGVLFSIDGTKSSAEVQTDLLACLGKVLG